MYFHYLLFTTLYKFHGTKTHMVHLTVHILKYLFMYECMHMHVCVLKIITSCQRIILNWPNAHLRLRTCVRVGVCVFDTFFIHRL